MKIKTSYAGYIDGKLVSEKDLKIKWVNIRTTMRDDILEEVRKALWKKAHKLHSIGLDELDIRQEPIEAVTLIGKEIDKFIDKLKKTTK